MKKFLIQSFLTTIIALSASSYGFATGQTPGSYTSYTFPNVTIKAMDLYTTIEKKSGVFI